MVTVTGKVVPVLNYALTSALVGEWSVSHPGRFTPGERAPAPIGYEDGWVPEPVWMIWGSESSWPYWDSNSELSVIQPVASGYTNPGRLTPGEKAICKDWVGPRNGQDAVEKSKNLLSLPAIEPLPWPVLYQYPVFICTPIAHLYITNLTLTLKATSGTWRRLV
jgi:hypothetical protein